MSDWRESLLPQLAPPLAAHIAQLPPSFAERVEEIRVRAGRRVLLRVGDDRRALPDGADWLPTPADIARLLTRMCEHSLYAREQEMAQGYVTLRGGFRVGLSGQVLMQGASVKALSLVTGLNIRILREVKGCADALLSSPGMRGRMVSTLIVSPPGQGKTTLLRDIARRLARDVDVAIVDERSEIAGCYLGVPQLDVGERCDVLDGCAKPAGLRMAIRSLSPTALITDEIGTDEDAAALREALCAGICVVASAHGDSLEGIRRKPSMRGLIGEGGFERLVLLGESRGKGTIERVEVAEG